MHANHREDVESAYAGDIVGVVGLKSTSTGDTLCDPNAHVLLEAIQFPEPVIAVAIEPKTKGDQDRLGDALSKLVEEDPTFRTRYDHETGQTIISGMGELHLEVITDRMMREYKVEARVGRPHVAYKETITAPTRGEGRFVRQTGGRGQYGHIILDMEPLARGSGFEFENKVVGGTVPREYIRAVQAGAKGALEGGGLHGYQVVDVKVIAIDGSYHPVDYSSKLRALGWEPEHEFEAALTATVQWYRVHPEWWQPLRSGEYLEYYERQYGARLGAGQG